MFNLLSGLWIALFVGTAVVHLAFAIGVYQAASFEGESRGVRYAPPGMWALATLLFGLWGAVAFWLIHQSALSVERRNVEGI